MVLVILASLEDTVSILTRPRPPRFDLPPDPEAPEALIEEARRRARRRRRGYAACTLVAAAGGLLAFYGFNGGGATRLETGAEQPSVGAQNVFARARGWITFRNGSEIVAVDPANPKDTLVLGRSPDDDPIAWSSDGSKLLLRSHQEGYGDPLPGLFVLHPDGSRTELVREISLLGSGPSHDFPGSNVTWGSFSPDGTAVVYGGDAMSRSPYIIDAKGGKPRPLGRRCPREKISGKLVERCLDHVPEAAAWSPDGSQIAWFDYVDASATHCDCTSVLSFVNPDGTSLREEVAPLPEGGGTGGNLVWSPDGSRLAFGDENGQIFVINADGSGLRQITRDGDNEWPAWSPDGSRIAFVHDGTLSTMAPDGTDMQSLDGVTPDGAIAWNPAE
jgi:Tol biopolymer transport system component